MYKKIDADQRVIVSTLRDAGASVCSLAPMGRGCPDLLAGWRGVNLLVEVKNKDGRNRLTPDEDAFIKCWRGKIYIVNTVEDALRLLDVELTGNCEGFERMG